MSNFLYIKEALPKLYECAHDAEQLAITSPSASAVRSRAALEVAVHWLYDNELELTFPSQRNQQNLSGLLHHYQFRNLIATFNMFTELKLIKDIGNNAAHGKKINQDTAISSVKYLYRMVRFIGNYYLNLRPDTGGFQDNAIPNGKEQEQTKAELAELIKKEELQSEALREAKNQLALQTQQNHDLLAEINQLRAEFTKQRKAQEQNISIAEALPHDVPEAETRKRFIDQSLREAGWDSFIHGKDVEFEVIGMPTSTNPSGKGYADYVLWGDNGKPLAVIEAKRTGKDPDSGRQQAILYADCLEQMYGQRPIIYYTNGFQTYMLDDTFYHSRLVYGFYSKSELETLIDRRLKRKDLRSFKVNQNIVGRPYQLEALQRIAETFSINSTNGTLRGRNRDALLVMATGTGKTRTAAALVDMLTQCNWAKRILFLADRNALVSQAKKAFKTHLENLSGIDLTKEKEDQHTRLVFSTYPTIMNKIDSVRTGYKRFYGIGHFDLIIIDEAHRSVYQKYKAIFDYFDSLVVGLTATPRTEIDRNTYSLFQIEDDVPTYAYELDEAVKDGFLVPPQGLELKLKFPSDGIKYKELSKNEQQEYEEKFGDPSADAEAPDSIESTAINQWLFNTDTQDKILQKLMERGIRVESGDKIGKTIIFAKSHKHAVFIKERFDKLYPEYDPRFAAVIDNYDDKAQSLLEDFCFEKEEKLPQIAISVDMMDTGVDAPRVVNLVFAKLVKSVSKYWQMIGRGTRLCPDLFAPHEDKEHFLIFDCAGNFKFYDDKPEGMNSSQGKNLTQIIYEAKVELGYGLLQFAEGSAQDQELGESLLAEAHKAVASLDTNRFQVQQQIAHVTKFAQQETWQNLNKVDLAEINNHISKIIPSVGEEDIDCRRFDRMMFWFMLAHIEGRSTDSYVKQIVTIAKGLRKKTNVPLVKKQIAVIEHLLTEAFWEELNAPSLNKVRIALREIVKFIEKETQETIYTNFKDELHPSNVTERPTEYIVKSSVQLTTYRERVEHYLKNHRHHIVIHKLQNNIPITKGELDALEQILHSEELGGDPAEYENALGEKSLGTFVRNILGLEQDVAQTLFADYLNSQNLSATQMNFIHKIVQYLTTNGVIDIGKLYEPPFSHLHSDGIDGVFAESQADKIIRILENVNANAEGQILA